MPVLRRRACCGPFRLRGVLAEGRGAEVVDLDGNVYIDFVQSWGAPILGHAPDLTTLGKIIGAAHSSVQLRRATEAWKQALGG